MTDPYEWQGEDPAPEFDLDLAQSYVGRTILIGVTYCDHAGAVTEQRQLHGRIVSADRGGISIALEGKRAGETWFMPPNLDSVRVAGAGEYRLRETGEVVIDPDLLATWTVRAGPPNH